MEEKKGKVAAAETVDPRVAKAEMREKRKVQLHRLADSALYLSEQLSMDGYKLTDSEQLLIRIAQVPELKEYLDELLAKFVSTGGHDLAPQLAQFLHDL